MRRTSKLSSALGLVAVAASAEIAARLLSPRDVPPPAPPAPLAAHFDAGQIARGRAFARPQRMIGLAGSVLDAAVLLTFSRRPIRRLDRLRPPALGGAVAGAGLTLILSAAGLPLGALARRRALAAGLATQSWPDWGSDVAKATALQTGFAALGAGALVEVGHRRPRHWWLVAAAGSAGLTGLVAALAPVVLDPLFNDFEPLGDAALRQDLLELAERAGVQVGDVLRVDASRRTTAANAYVAGLGPTKRVVVFDTLLERYSREELRVVVAHELSHVRSRDVPRGIAFAALLAPAAILATGAIARALTGESRPVPSRLPGLALAAGLATAPAAPVAARFSRRLERQADELSLALTGDTEAFIAFERRVAAQNLADVDPPRWVRLLASHPPAAERIGHALRAASMAPNGAA